MLLVFAKFRLLNDQLRNGRMYLLVRHGDAEKKEDCAKQADVGIHYRYPYIHYAKTGFPFVHNADCQIRNSGLYLILPRILLLCIKYCKFLLECI